MEYQRKNGYSVWRGYDKEVFKKDIAAGNQYKILIDSQIAIVFSVCYSDKVIWRDKELGNSVYLHRIAVNPIFKGQRLFGKILSWAIDHAKRKGLSSVRMDTWADNPTIIEYYKSFGLNFIENYITPDSPELSSQHRNLGLALLELKLE
jgi:ribosomal protein S18 acetylase RimI-like enzyme